MGKNLKHLIRMMTVSVLLIASLSACSSGNKSDDKAIYTITFLNGDTTLGTVEVEGNATLDASKYASYETIEDAEFNGWFETPTFLESSKKDLKAATFTKDTTLYGSFKSTKVTEDTRVWYIAGTSEKGILKESNWAGSEVEDSIKSKLQLSPTGKATNEFAITTDLFQGDQFQMIHDWAWDGQKGYGCFTTIDNTQMESGGGLGGSADTSNVVVLQDGNYTITLTTDPDNSAQDTITIVRNGDPLTAPVVEEKTAYTVSENTGVSIKGSWVEDWSDVKELERTEGTDEFSITMDLPANTELCFVVLDKGEDAGIVIKEENVKDEASLVLLTTTGNNIKVTEKGSYTFTVDAAAQTVIITK